MERQHLISVNWLPSTAAQLRGCVAFVRSEVSKLRRIIAMAQALIDESPKPRAAFRR